MNQPWHLITPEYPPQVGGVSDYTYQVAAELARRGDQVHVWCPAFSGDVREAAGVTVHRELGEIAIADLVRVGRLLDEFPARRRILVQWVPHGYGHRSMNLPFCCWLWGRSALHDDQVEIMMHEPFLSFGEGSWLQNVAALVHRVMTVILLRAAEYVWISTPAWESCWRPYALGRRIPFHWLPIPSNICIVDDPEGVELVRQRYLRGRTFLIGHFGTYGRPVTSLLEPVLFKLAAESDDPVLLMGRGSEIFRQRLIRKDPRLTGRLHATETLAAEELSRHIDACDLLIQPYPDGVTSRNCSMMAGISHGKPVVTTSGRLTEPVWKEYSGVALAPAGDVEEFVRLVRLLKRDTSERCRMGQSARQLYRERFDLLHTVEALRREKESNPLLCTL